MLTPEYFKGDANELKVDAALSPLTDQIGEGLDKFYVGGYEAAPFLLMLYDERRIPFAERVSRQVFVEFIRTALGLLPFIGVFETYLFILRGIFGSLSEINFTVPAPGVLNIDIDATSNIEFEFVAREPGGVLTNVVTLDGDQLIFRSVAGIDTAYELELMLSELIPAGISPHVTLGFYTRYTWLVEDPEDEFYTLVDNLGNEIILYEIGG